MLFLDYNPELTALEYEVYRFVSKNLASVSKMKMKELAKETHTSYKLPKKVRRLAMKSVLSEKVASNNLVAVEGLSFDAPKTKEFKQVLANLTIDSKVLVVLESENDFAALSARNLPKVSVVTADNISVLDIVSNDKMLVTQTALTQIEEVLA